MKIYLAGPLFTAAEKFFNTALAAELRRVGHDVFVPQENEQGPRPMAIFLSDKGGIDWCDVILANMDGPDPDSGTCWEVGYGYGKKYVVLFRTDIRNEGGTLGPYNLMMTQAANLVLDLRGADLDRTASRIIAVLESLP
jgi:nucleoside 2-deoxyribosyltransferase